MVFSGSHSLYFESIDKDLLSDVCEFLQRSVQITATLSDKTKPVLFKVVSLSNQLIDYCLSKSDEISGMKKLKSFLSK